MLWEPHQLRLAQVWTFQMYIENYKRDTRNSAVIAVNADSINKHRNTLRQKKQLKEHLESQEIEISSLKKEVSELKSILSNLINQKN